MPKITRRPSIKMQRLAQELVRTGNGAQAAINAGYDVTSRDSAAAMTSEYLGKHTFREMVKTELQRVGATKGNAISVIYERMVDKTPQNAALTLKAAQFP